MRRYSRPQIGSSDGAAPPNSDNCLKRYANGAKVKRSARDGATFSSLSSVLNTVANDRAYFEASIISSRLHRQSPSSPR